MSGSSIVVNHTSKHNALRTTVSYVLLYLTLCSPFLKIDNYLVLIINVRIHQKGWDERMEHIIDSCFTDRVRSSGVGSGI